MSTMASQITSLAIVYSTVYSRRKSKKTFKLRVTGLCAGISPVTGEIPTQRASNAENVSIWWRHHAIILNNGNWAVSSKLPSNCIRNSNIFFRENAFANVWNMSGPFCLRLYISTTVQLTTVSTVDGGRVGIICNRKPWMHYDLVTMPSSNLNHQVR